MEKPRAHRKLVIAIIVLATVIGLLSVLSIWAKRQVLETETWTNTSTKLLRDKAVQSALSSFMVEELYDNVDVEAELAAALPGQAKALAGPAAAGLRELAGKAATEALARPKVQALWSEANRAAHDLFLELVEGGGEKLSTEGGNVSLDLGPIVTQLGERLGIDVAEKLPPEVAKIQLVESEDLGLVQDAVNWLKDLSLILPLLALALYAIAIYLARGWRREAVRAWGISWILIGVIVLVVRSIAGEVIVDELVKNESVKPAGEAVWDIATSLLHDGGIAMLIYGLAIVLGAVLAGPMGLAVRARRNLAPLLRERPAAYAVAAVIALLLIWWAPTEGFRRPLPLLMLLVLFVAGIEALRHQTLREFPGETWDTLRSRWSRGAGGSEAVAAAAPAPPPAPAAPSPEPTSAEPEGKGESGSEPPA